VFFCPGIVCTFQTSGDLAIWIRLSALPYPSLAFAGTALSGVEWRATRRSTTPGRASNLRSDQLFHTEVGSRDTSYFRISQRLTVPTRASVMRRREAERDGKEMWTNMLETGGDAAARPRQPASFPGIIY